MLIYLLLLLNVFLLFYTFSSFSDKKRILVLLAEAVSVFLCLYALSAAIMWLFEGFTPELCLIPVTVLDAIFFTIAYIKSPLKGIEFFYLSKIKADHRILFNSLAIFAALAASIGAYSTIGIGRNDGNAQIQALSILNGNNSIRFTLDEYDDITPDSKYEYFFFDSVSNIDIENFTASYWISEEGGENGEEKMWGELGGNPTYPSILALSSRVFGKDNMAFIQAVFAFCVFVFINELLRELKCEWKLRSILILLLSLSPIVVYCNHTTLVEPLIAFCMVMFAYFLLCKKNLLQMVSALSVLTFGLLHASVYTMLPLFLILYWISYIHTREKRHLFASVLALAGYIFSFIYLNITAFENTYINYVLGIPFFKGKNYIFAVMISVITLIAGVVLFFVFRKIDGEKVKGFERGKGKIIFKILVALSSMASIVIMIVLNVKKCESYADMLNITFIAFLVCSGVILIPYVIGRLISTVYNPGLKEASVVVMFVYSILFYSSVMKPMLDGYYYEARYLASFMPFVILASGMMLANIKFEGKFIIPVISILLLLFPYTSTLFSNKAEMRLDKNVFDSVMSTVEDNLDEDTIIFVEKGILKDYYYPLLNAYDAKVYPIQADYIDDFCLDIKDVSSRVLYISDFNGNVYRDRGSLKYYSENKSNLVSEEALSTVTGLPVKFTEGDTQTAQVMVFDNLGCLLEYDDYDYLRWNEINMSVTDIEIDEDIATVKVALTDGSRILTDDRYDISFHLDYEESDDIFECHRIPVGPYVLEDYEFRIDLSGLNEKMTVAFDVVEEGVAWYSYDHEVPAVVFDKDESGRWNCKVESYTGER
ncbi:MAG: hypothetical protein K5988_07650 [Lachnospiraceae bacterium]|nr:hypothetical protein [Lachnospiraceae bacterium]